jgi:hypothetical protein
MKTDISAVWHHRIDKPHYECSCSGFYQFIAAIHLKIHLRKCVITELNERRFKSCIIPILLK